MKTLHEIEELQEKLDEEILICPACWKKETFGFFRNYGCKKAFEEYMRDSRIQDLIEEEQNAKI